ncbi:hypothetical protein L218DRAFT_965710 [Marasmius fiardii PR-910]|nr:hypothetical protein L218DRAFT_965710 [Marasmius fiardii PR-910]
MPSNSNYVVPSHWKLDQIREYRRHTAVIRHWKGAKPLRIPPKFKLQPITYNPRPALTSVMSGMSNMNINNTDIGSGSQTEGSS